MSTELMSRFLEDLHASRLLEIERIEELLRRPEPPQGDMDGVVQFLEVSGWLTRFQIDEIREGRGTTLTFAGYRILEKLGDQPSGPVFRAFHPALQKQVVLRWLNREWVEPADSLAGFIERAQAASLVTNPHLVGLLDAGIAHDRPFLVQEFIEGADLGRLVVEMGALPSPLACEYVRQAALALQAGAERGVFHGDLSPAHLLLTPVIRKPGSNGTGQIVSIRPAPGASVRVCELGLIPIRPSLSELAAGNTSMLGEYAYAAPERLTQSVRDHKADLWSLGASLYFLLTARPPYPAKTVADFMQQIQQTEPVRVDRLRNDVPAPLADFVHRMLSRDPGQRPENAKAVAEFLAPFCQFGSPPVARPIAQAAVPLASETGTIPKVPPVARAIDDLPMAEELPHVEPLPAGTSDSQVFSPRASAPEPLSLGNEPHDVFADHHGEESRPVPPRKEESGGGHSWIILAILLHVIPIGVLVLYLTDTYPFGRSISSSTTTTQESKPANSATPKKLNKPSKI